MSAERAMEETPISRAHGYGNACPSYYVSMCSTQPSFCLLNDDYDDNYFLDADDGGSGDAD